MATLVVLSVGTGYVFSLGATFFYEGEVFYEAASVLLVFILLGHWLEMRARAGASDAIRALMDLAPPMATVVRNGVETKVPTAEVLQSARLVVIKPGDKIPVDGEIIEGASQVDESMLTGESMPVKKVVGNASIGATINKSGSFRYQATKVGADTALGADRQAGAGGAELEGPRPAAGRPGIAVAGAGGDRDWPADLQRLVLGDGPDAAVRTHLDHHRVRDRLP
jgi:cation transport ATPase